jgi:hypothetical protein
MLTVFTLPVLFVAALVLTLSAVYLWSKDEARRGRAWRLLRLFISVRRK